MKHTLARSEQLIQVIDYHENVNSNINERLIPTFQRVYPFYRMCLVFLGQHNTPYHHQLVPIGSLQSKSKKEILEIMEEDNVDVLNSPWTDTQWDF